MGLAGLDWVRENGRDHLSPIFASVWVNEAVLYAFHKYFSYKLQNNFIQHNAE